MIHYNVWFSFKDSVAPVEGLTVIHTFLEELRRGREIASYQLLENKGTGARTKMLPLQALIEFRDGAQFSATFSAQAARGIHTGWHGRMLTVVDQFQIEVFQQLSIHQTPPLSEPVLDYACEL